VFGEARDVKMPDIVHHIIVPGALEFEIALPKRKVSLYSKPNCAAPK